MEQIFGFITADIPKIAIFLLFFAAVAVIFEIFYFRRKKSNESTEVVQTIPARQDGKRNLIIIAIALVLLALPVSIYIVLQQVRFQNQAQQPAPQYGCDEIDILRDNAVVDPSALSANNLVTFAGYCFMQGGSVQRINRIRFVITDPSGVAAASVYLAFAATEKTTADKAYVKAFYPNFTFTGIGTYTVQIWAYDRDTALTSQPFVRTFSVSTGTSSIVTSPTLSPGAAGGQAPICGSLSAIPLTGPAPLTVSLTGSGRDDGQVAAFEFTFGDGTRQTVTQNVGKSGSVSTSHVYQAGGDYTATLRVQDNTGNFSSPSALCSVALSVTKGVATTSAQLKAQPTKAPIPTPTTVTLPVVGVSMPMVGLIGSGIFLLAAGLLFAF